MFNCTFDLSSLTIMWYWPRILDTQTQDYDDDSSFYCLKNNQIVDTTYYTLFTICNLFATVKNQLTIPSTVIIYGSIK